MTNISSIGGGDQSRRHPLGAILDIRGDLYDQNFVLTGGGNQSRWGPPRGHFGHKGDPYDQNFDPTGWGPIMVGTP